VPDDPRFGGTGPDGAADPDEEPTGRRGRRRRSMEASGGLSVSDLVQRHTGSRPNLPRPTPPAAEPPPPSQPGGRRRAAQAEPTVPPTSRAGRSNPGTGQHSGQHPVVPQNDQPTGRRALREPGPVVGARPGESTGRRAAITPPGEATGRRAAVPPPGEATGRRAMPPGGPRPGESSLSNMRRPMPPGGRPPMPPPCFPSGELMQSGSTVPPVPQQSSLRSKRCVPSPIVRAVCG